MAANEQIQSQVEVAAREIYDILFQSPLFLVKVDVHANLSRNSSIEMKLSLSTRPPLSLNSWTP
jgi:hypothetical protein